MLQVFSPNPTRWKWLSLSGRDAPDFLQRLSTVDVKHLTPGDGHDGLFLTPQAKIVAYFSLWRLGPEDFGFEFDPGKGALWHQRLLDYIDHFKFSETFSIQETAGELAVRWIFFDESDLPLLWEKLGLRPISVWQSTTPSQQPNVRVYRHPDRLTVWAKPFELDPWFEMTLPGAVNATPAEMEKIRILHARPGIDAEIVEQANPLEIALHGAIHPAKGCYPGQEVVEKIIALGNPPKRLVRVEGLGRAPEPGTKLYSLADPPMEAGMLTSVQPNDGGYIALASVRKILATEGLALQLSATPSEARIVHVAPYV